MLFRSLRLGSFERRKGNPQECTKVSCPPVPIQVKCRKRQEWKGCEHFIPGESCVHVSPPLSTLCAGIARRQVTCNGSVLNPGILFCVCAATRRVISLVSALRPPLQDSRVVRAKVPPKQKEKARGKAVSHIPFLVYSPRPLHQIEGALVVPGEEGYLQALC